MRLFFQERSLNFIANSISDLRQIKKIISRFLRLDDEIIEKFKNENIGCQGEKNGKKGGQEEKETTSEGKKNEIEKPVGETIEVFTTFFTIKKW